MHAQTRHSSATHSSAVADDEMLIKREVYDKLICLMTKDYQRKEKNDTKIQKWYLFVQIISHTYQGKAESLSPHVLTVSVSYSHCSLLY